MQKTWQEIVRGFETTPFLIVGSGLSRRYLNLPCWKDLLLYFAKKVSPDEYFFNSLLFKANHDLAVVGSLLEQEFNEKWFKEAGFRSKDLVVKEAVLGRNVSPFKAEVARYLTSASNNNPEYSAEIELLKTLADRHLSGFITTNYDTFLEKQAPFFKTFVGQDDLLLSHPQEIAEIFKIHGTIKQPQTLVLTKEDYDYFSKKRAYLAAKLLTIFIEYPVIFIGYSLGDSNVNDILSSIIDCLDEKRMEKLSKSLIFIQRDSSLPSSIEIETLAKEINGKTLLMTNVRTDDFLQIFEGLKEVKRRVPVKLLRMFKNQIYELSVTSKPSKHLAVNVGDPRIPEDKLVFSIGVEQKSTEKGLIGITLSEWNKEVVLSGSSGYTAKQLLSVGYDQVRKTCGGTDLPVFKFLSEYPDYPEINKIREVKKFQDFDSLISKTLKDQRNKGLGPKTIAELNSSPKFTSKIYQSWALLPEDQIDLKELEKFLFVKFREKPDLLTSNIRERSDINRLIRIYDWLKYGKNKPITKEK